LVEAAGVASHANILSDEQVSMLKSQFKFQPGSPVAGPTFDQGMPWHEVREADMRRIVQGGAYFTYGEQSGSYNHAIDQRMIEPTPVFVEWIK